MLKFFQKIIVKIFIFSSLFFFENTTYCCRARRLSVCPSVCLLSVEIISFRGNSLSNKPIDLKIGLNVSDRGGSACPKGVIFRNSNCKLQIYAICKFLQVNLRAQS